jgi:hypothetical protein
MPNAHHKLPYEPPRLDAVGSVHDLTLARKTIGLSDGDWLVTNDGDQGLATVS